MSQISEIMYNLNFLRMVFIRQRLHRKAIQIDCDIVEFHNRIVIK